MKIIRIVVHHSADSYKGSQFDKINTYHKTKFNLISSTGFYGGYNYLLERDGTIKQYRPDGEETAAQKGYNFDSLSICMAGNFDIEMPTQKQVSSLRQFLKSKMLKYNIPTDMIMPHRSLGQTSCYGNNLTDDWAKHIAESNGYSDEETKISILTKMIELYERLIYWLKR